MERNLEGDWLVASQMVRENDCWRKTNHWYGKDCIWHLPKGMGCEMQLYGIRYRANFISPNRVILRNSHDSCRIELERI